MHSSISSSNPAYRRSVAISLVAAAATLIFIESVTRFGFQRVSRLESRTAQEYRQALALRPAPPGQPPNILIAGNSLLLAGMDESINKLVAPQARVYRLVVEQTHYIDWHYGVRRLLADGSQPDYLILCIGPTHWVSDVIRGDYSSYYLYRTPDIPSVARDAGYGLTRQAGLFTARYSMYYAGRANLRNFLLHRLYPGYSDIQHDLTTHPAPDFPLDKIEQTVEGRLRELTATIGHRTRFAMLIPPTFVNYEEGIRQAAEKVGVRLLVPIHAGELPEEMFVDHMHVSDAGSRKFMAILAGQLKDLVAARPVPK